MIVYLRHCQRGIGGAIVFKVIVIRVKTFAAQRTAVIGGQCGLAADVFDVYSARFRRAALGLKMLVAVNAGFVASFHSANSFRFLPRTSRG
jgi:hypothetical protein